MIFNGSTLFSANEESMQGVSFLGLLPRLKYLYACNR